MSTLATSQRPASIDVVVPSIRLDAAMLLPILSLRAPAGVTVRYYVVGDDPQLALPDALVRRAAHGDLELLRNETNRGAGGARNRGLEAGAGELVVFVDDDVVPEPDLLERYVDAVTADGSASPGYVGVTRFPAPCSAFTRGVVASDMLTFFDIAATRVTLTWGVTANLCLRRSTVGSHRFRDCFPREGGGEDIDLCLRILAAAPGKHFRCVPGAIVTHPWWNGGRRHYRRFFRWAYGDSALPTLHAAFRFRAPPTLVEAVALAVPPLAALVSAGTVVPLRALAVLMAMMTVEFGVDYGKLVARGARVGIRTSMEATLVRMINDLGRLVGHVRAARIAGLCERFDYFGTGEGVGYERRVATAKLILWLGAAILLLVARPRG